jgi:hypothetical protein
MPMDLGESISELSKIDKRSMNTTIVLLLESAMKEKNRKRKKPILPTAPAGSQ